MDSIVALSVFDLWHRWDSVTSAAKAFWHSLHCLPVAWLLMIVDQVTVKTGINTVSLYPPCLLLWAIVCEQTNVNTLITVVKIIVDKWKHFCTAQVLPGASELSWVYLIPSSYELLQTSLRPSDRVAPISSKIWKIKLLSGRRAGQWTSIGLNETQPIRIDLISVKTFQGKG